MGAECCMADAQRALGKLGRPVERPQTRKWVGGLGEFYLRCDERVVEIACSKLGVSDAQRQFGRIFGALNFFFQLVWIGHRKYFSNGSKEGGGAGKAGLLEPKERRPG
jgi:hypothetical protein